MQTFIQQMFIYLLSTRHSAIHSILSPNFNTVLLSQSPDYFALYNAIVENFLVYLVCACVSVCVFGIFIFWLVKSFFLKINSFFLIYVT